MKKTKNIHNLDSLEKEIYRLRLETRVIEDKLDNNLDHLRENFSSMVMNSVCHKSESAKKEKNGSFDFGIKNEKLNTMLNKITGHIADRAAGAIDKLVDRLFEKSK